METKTANQRKGIPPEGLAADHEYRYAAFISYRHTPMDRGFAKWLHSQIERYRAPRELVKRGVQQRVGRVFRDEEELAASADLSEEIEHALEQSQHLIVICSRLTPESRWVNEEIKRFHSLGRGDRILALLIDGEPDEAFPAALFRGIGPDDVQAGGAKEPLAADVRHSEDESERSLKHTAKLKIIATLLGCNYDDLRRRELERQRRRWAAGLFSLGALVVVISSLAGLAWYQKGVAVEQRQLAVARQLTAQSELIRAQQPNLIEDSALLAAAAMKRFVRLGAPSLEADQALRNLLALLPKNPKVLQHSAVISAVAYGSNGQLGAASANGEVTLWDVSGDGSPGEADPTGRNYHLLTSANGTRVAFGSTEQPILTWQTEIAESTETNLSLARPEHIVFSADADRFAFGRGKTLRIWDATSNRDVRQIAVQKPVSQLAMSADGNRIAAVGYTPELEVFDTGTGAQLARFTHPDMETIKQISFGPAGSALLASVSMTRLDMFDHRYVVSLWDIAHKAAIRQVEYRAIVDEVLIDPLGQIMAVRIEDGSVRILAIEQDRKDLILPHHNSVRAAVFGPTGHYLATMDGQGTVRVWNTISGQEVSRIARGSTVPTMAFSPDGQRLAIAVGNRVYVQDAIAMEAQAQLDVGGTVRALDFDPQLEAIAIGVGEVGTEGAVHLWRPNTGEHWHQRVDYNYSVEITLFSPNDTDLLIGSADPVSCASDAYLMNASTLFHGTQPDKIHLAEPIPGCLSSAAFSPNGDYLVAAGYNDPVARIWETTSGQLTASLQHADVILAVAWSPNDNGLIATAGYDGKIRFWKQGKEISSLDQGSKVTSLAFGPEGRRLVSGGESGIAYLWDVESGIKLSSPIAHENYVLAVAYAPDGRHFATSGRDNRVQIWSGDGHRMLGKMRHDDAVEILAFSPDGQHIATAETGGKVHVWTVPAGVEIARSLHGNAIKV
ncbi:MAG: TIR domain-containing protein, partial [Chromatiales bacterium]